MIVLFTTLSFNPNHSFELIVYYWFLDSNSTSDTGFTVLLYFLYLFNNQMIHYLFLFFGVFYFDYLMRWYFMWFFLFVLMLFVYIESFDLTKFDWNQNHHSIIRIELTKLYFDHRISFVLDRHTLNFTFIFM